MMRRLHIFSKRLLGVIPIVLAPSFLNYAVWGATVGGDIKITSGQENSRREQQLDLSDVVVWLEPVKPLANEPLEPARAQLLQKNKTFSPHVLVVPVGAVVDFPNADPIFHSAFSNYDGQLFDLTLYPPGTTKSVRFHKQGIVRVFCNIHPTMSAVIVVLDTPYFTKANRDGTYELTNVPPGNYELRFFDERSTAKQTEWAKISIPSAQSEVHPAATLVSEEGHAPLPHKNKYGLDYPPDRQIDQYGGLPK
jgi:plastocyanin